MAPFCFHSLWGLQSSGHPFGGRFQNGEGSIPSVTARATPWLRSRAAQGRSWPWGSPPNPHTPSLLPLGSALRSLEGASGCSVGTSGWPWGLLEGDPLQELPSAGLTRCGQACQLPRQAPWGREGSSVELVPDVGSRPAACTPVRDSRPPLRAPGRARGFSRASFCCRGV